ncbi:MAG: hypothetical protein WDZ49_07560 [Litorilinea sp.]
MAPTVGRDSHRDTHSDSHSDAHAEGPRAGQQPGNPAVAVPEVPTARRGRSGILTGLWRAIHHPASTLLPALLVLLLAIAAQIFPQMPGQLNYEPATAARWLIAATAEGNIAGSAAALGLYNVLDHPLLKLALVLLVLAFAVRLAGSIGSLLAFRTWPNQAQNKVTEPGMAASLQNYALLYRRRRPLDTTVDQIADRLEPELAHLQTLGYSVDHFSIPYPNHASDQNADHLAEPRYVLWRNRRSTVGSIVRDGGLLLSAVVAWVVVVFGWNTATPILAPGEGFQSTVHNLEIHYAADAPQPESTPQLALTLRADAIGASPLAAEPQQMLRGDYLLRVDAPAPGLLLSIVDHAAEPRPAPALSLRRLAQSESGSTLGIVLANANGEETVLLPELAAGLRIVRHAGEDMLWQVEYYGAGDIEPRARWEIDPTIGGALELPDHPVTIYGAPARGLQFSINYMPSHRLLWVGLALALLSLPLTIRRPFFGLIQLAPWHGHTVLIVQTTSLAALSQTGLLNHALLSTPPVSDTPMPDAPMPDAPEQEQP